MADDSQITSRWPNSPVIPSAGELVDQQGQLGAFRGIAVHTETLQSDRERPGLSGEGVPGCVCLSGEALPPEVEQRSKTRSESGKGVHVPAAIVTEDFLVSRRFREISTQQQRMELLECVFAVSAADESITVVEEGQARQISKELGLTHNDFIRARHDYREHLAALKTLRRTKNS